MKPSTLIEAITQLAPLRRPLCIEGAPGGGKSSVVRQAAKALDVPCRTVFVANMLPEDWGYPNPESLKSGRVSYTLPDWFPEADKPLPAAVQRATAHPSHTQAAGVALAAAAPQNAQLAGILLLDDSNQASPDMQKAVANLIQDRELHGYRLHPGWTVIRTGNRKQDRAGSSRVFTHLANRETTVTCDTDLGDCIEWASSHGVDPRIIAYWTFRPGQLHDFDPNRDKSPTPRSWCEGVNVSLQTGIAGTPLLELIQGDIGEGAGAEFFGFLEIWRGLPTIQMILKAPKDVSVPTEAAERYATVGMLADHTTRETLPTLAVYLERLPAEYQTVYWSTMGRKDATMMDTETFSTWAQKNYSMVF